MKMNKKTFALAMCFMMLNVSNLQSNGNGGGQHQNGSNHSGGSSNNSGSNSHQNPTNSTEHNLIPVESAPVTVSLNISAQVVTPVQALAICTTDFTISPLDFIYQLVSNKLNDFVFTLNSRTYIIQSTANHAPAANTVTPEVATSTTVNGVTTVTETVTGAGVTPEQAALVLAEAAAMFAIENFTDSPIAFVEWLFNNSANQFVFTVDGVTYIIQS